MKITVWILTLVLDDFQAVLLKSAAALHGLLN